MRLLLGMLAACALTACAMPHPVYTTPQWDSRFGDSVRATLARQIIDPQAGSNRDPVAGMNGRAANAAYQRYQRTFQEPASQPSFTIGASGAK